MNPLAERAIAQQEQKLGASLDYLRSLADVSTSLFAKFGLTTPAATHRKHAPRDAWHLARLGATRVQDCGTCLQIIVNVALKDGVAPEVLCAALDDRLNDLDAPGRWALRFGEAVAERAPDLDEVRTRLESLVGQKATVELALAVAMAQVYPILKRGLGQAIACTRVEIAVGGIGGGDGAS